MGKTSLVRTLLREFLIVFALCALVLLSAPPAAAQEEEEFLAPIYTMALAVSPDGELIALGRTPNRCIPMDISQEQRSELRNQFMVQIMDVHSGQEVARITGLMCPIEHLEWSTLGTQLAVSEAGYYPPFVYHFDTQAWSSPRAGIGGIMNGRVAWSSDDHYMAYFWLDSPDVYVFDSMSFDLIASFRTNEQLGVAAVDWNSHSGYLAISTAGGHLEIWDISEVSTPQLVVEQPFVSNVVDWNPDGSILALGINDLLLVEPLTGMIQQTLIGHTDVVLDIKWSSDGRYLASGGLDGTLRIWDVLHGSEVAQYPVNPYSPAFGWSTHSPEIIYVPSEAANPVENNIIVIADVE